MCFINHDTKIIFTQIPKTGGAAVRQSIQTSSPGSSVWVAPYHGKISKELAEKYPDYKKFTVVRNSYSIMVSMYRWWYRRNIPSPEQSRVTRNIRYAKDQPVIKSFKEWLQWDKVAQSESDVFHQLDFLRFSDSSGQQRWHDNFTVLRYENLEEELAMFGKRIGAPLKLTKRKIHFFGTYDWKAYYDEEIKEIVRTKCKADIDHFKFEFQ